MTQLIEFQFQLDNTPKVNKKEVLGSHVLPVVKNTRIAFLLSQLGCYIAEEDRNGFRVLQTQLDIYLASPMFMESGIKYRL